MITTIMINDRARVVLPVVRRDASPLAHVYLADEMGVVHVVFIEAEKLMSRAIKSY